MGTENMTGNHEHVCSFDESQVKRVRHGNHECIVIDKELHYHQADKCSRHGFISDDIDIDDNDIVRTYHMSRFSPSEKTTGYCKYAVMIGLTGMFFIVELVFGFLIKSLALQSDAFHMLSDVLAMSIGYVAKKLVAKENTSDKFSFGYARAEVIGSLINSVFLLASCLFILFSTIERFFDYKDTDIADEANELIIVASIGLFINVIGMILFHEHSHDEEMNLNDEGVMLHIFGDLLGSAIVIISGLLVKFIESEYALLSDPIGSVFIVLILVYNSIGLAKKSVRILLHKTPLKLTHTDIKNELLELNGVIDVHNLHIWSLNQDVKIASLHFITGDETNVGSTIDEIKKILHSHGIHKSSIQFEMRDNKNIDNGCTDPHCGNC